MKLFDNKDKGSSISNKIDKDIKKRNKYKGKEKGLTKNKISSKEEEYDNKLFDNKKTEDEKNNGNMDIELK